MRAILLCNFYTWAIEFCLHTSPTIFPVILSSLTFVPDILQTHRLKIYLSPAPLFPVLFSADVTFSILIPFLSFSCSHFPIPFFLLTDAHTYASRQANRTIHPLQHWNCPQATLVKQRAVAFTSLLYTHIPPTPRLPPPRSKRCPSVRLPVSPSVYSQLPACQCLNWANVRAFVYGGTVCFCDNLVPHIVPVTAVITVWRSRRHFQAPFQKKKSLVEKKGFEVTIFMQNSTPYFSIITKGYCKYITSILDERWRKVYSNNVWQNFVVVYIDKKKA